MTAVASLSSISQWVTPQEFARLYNRSPWTIYYWLRIGFLGEIGIKSFRDVRGRWWICVASL